MSLQAKTSKKIKNKIVSSKAVLKPTMAGEDMPTALIAPSDYEHIYAEDSKERKLRSIKAKQVKVNEVSSDLPTCLIGPDDYAHLYSAKRDPKAKAIWSKKRAAEKAIPDDAPTVLKEMAQRPSADREIAREERNEAQNETSWSCACCLLM